MSYDISLAIDTGRSELVDIAEVGNYTSNCAPMWAKALGFPIRDLHGRLAGGALELVRAAVKRMREDPETYRAMNPSNGWGESVSATEYLAKLAELCEQHPKATVQVDH